MVVAAGADSVSHGVESVGGRVGEELMTTVAGEECTVVGAANRPRPTPALAFIHDSAAGASPRSTKAARRLCEKRWLFMVGGP